jgi:DNA (cytosine-5)-methyltransferase 1
MSNTIPLFWPHELVIDLFAGGAGASSGIAKAIGRSVDIAVNHDPEAMMVHRANHPETMHYGGDVFEVKPRVATRGQKVALLWASPSCTFFSRARTVTAGEMDVQVRALADVVIVWAREAKPTLICMEQVVEWLDWGPLYPMNDPKVPKKLRGRPIKERKGEEFRRWLGELQNAGYVVEWQKRKAHHFGAPTSRERLFLVARRDGRPIVWPEPTHGPGLLPYETVRSRIDYSVPCRSIFDPTRRKPVVEATHRRIARGLKKFGHEHISPANRHTLVQVGYGEHKNQKPRVLDLDKPLTTIVASSVKHALVEFISKAYGGNYSGAGLSLDDPLSTITCIDHHKLVQAHANGDHRTQCREWLDQYIGKGAFPEVEDIAMRSLTPRELFDCQGFPHDYIINPTVRGKGLSTTAQVRLVGNSVPPIMAEVLVRANIATAEALRVA